MQIEAAPYNAKFEIKISKQIGHRKDKPTSKHQDKWSEILLNKPLFSRTFLLFTIITVVRSYLSSCHKSQEVVLEVFQELIALLMALCAKSCISEY